MNAKVNGLALILLPASITVSEVKQVFDSVLKKLQEETNIPDDTRSGYVAILNQRDLFNIPMVEMPNERLVTVAENLLSMFGNDLSNKVKVATSFVCEYYGPRDLVNHEVVTMFASVKENSADWDYLSRKGLTFLVYQCRDILSNNR
jgi:hypothetical protein